MKRLKQQIGKAAAAALSAALMLTAAPMPHASAAESVVLKMNLIGGGSVIGIGYQLEPVSGTLKEYEVALDGLSIEPESDGTFSTYDYAMNMTKTHTVKVTDKTGETVLEKETSVCSYLNTLIKTPGYEEYYYLSRNMLWYGGAAQKYFGVDTEHLASTGISSSDLLMTDLPEDDFNKDKFNQKLGLHGAPVKYVGMNLSLQSEIKFSLFFEPNYNEAPAVEYLKTCSFGGKRVNPVKNGNGYQVSVTVNAKDLDTSVKFADEDDLAEAFRPTQYITAAVKSGNKSLCMVCDALYLYGYAVNNPGYATGDVVYKWETLPEYTGRATTYNYQYQNGNAHLDDYAKAHNLYAAALTDDDYKAYAGAMIEINREGRKIKALVVDKMPISDNPGRDKGDVDLDPAGFEALTGANTGDFPITWRVIELEPAQGSFISYRLQHGTNQWYIKIQPRNNLYPLKKFEYMDDNDVYHEVTRTDDNCYEIQYADEKPFSQHHMTFRMTDIFGETVTDNNVDLDIPLEELKTDVNLPVPENGVQFGRTIE